MAAAIAFYTALSFAPLVLLVVAIGGFLGDARRNELLHLFSSQLGPKAEDAARVVAQTAERSDAQPWWRWAAGTAGLIVTASGVFGQLQASLNRVWGVEAVPGQGLWGWLRKRLLSMGMVMAILFVLLVSLVVSATVMRYLGGLYEAAGWAGDACASVVVSTLCFAAVFKVLPDARTAWRDVWVGAAITAALFTAGKAALAVYLEKGRVGSGYGEAAGGLVALLVWVYYSSVILLAGAVATRRFAAAFGRGTRPGPHARTLPATAGAGACRGGSEGPHPL